MYLYTTIFFGASFLFASIKYHFIALFLRFAAVTATTINERHARQYAFCVLLFDDDISLCEIVVYVIFPERNSKLSILIKNQNPSFHTSCTSSV